MAHECPACREHRERSEFGAEGWLHPSGQYGGLLVCNCCGGYYDETPSMLIPVPYPDQYVLMCVSRYTLAR